MSDSVWLWWKFADRPEDGVYEVLMFAGLETSNENVRLEEKTLYVCKSLEGGLTIAFSYQEIMNKTMIQCRKNGDVV